MLFMQPLTLTELDQIPYLQENTKHAAEKIFPKLAGKVTADTVSVIRDLHSLHHWYVLNSPYRYHWLCGGIGTGKSRLLARYALKRVMKNWETVGCIAANSYDQLSQSTLPHLFTLLKESGLKYVVDRKPPKSWKPRDLFKKGYDNIISIRVATGKVAHILTRTLNNHKFLKGRNIGWAALDEIADTKLEAWAEVTERLRCPLSHKLQIVIFGMPDMPGDNWTWKEFSNPDNQDLYKITFLSTTQVAHASWENYIKPLLRRMDPLEALQKIYARIVINRTGRVYHSYREKVDENQLPNNQAMFDYDPFKTLYWSHDFNILSDSPASSVLFQVHWDKKNKEYLVQVLDEIVLPRSTTDHSCYEFLDRYREHRGKIEVFGDCSGELSQTIPEFSRIATILGPVFKGKLKIHRKRSNPSVTLRIFCVNGLLRNAFGKARLFIHEKCAELIEDLNVLQPKDGGIDKSDKKRSHTSDALGYALFLLFPPVGAKKSKGVKGNI